MPALRLLLTALAISDRDGSPFAPLAMQLRAAQGTHCTRVSRVRETLSPLDELGPTMAHIHGMNLGRPVLHILDAEADSIAHYREWSQAGHAFLVRADNRLATWNGRERKLADIHHALRKTGGVRHIREVSYRGQKARQYVASTTVVLTRPGQRNRPGTGDRRRIPGPPLELRVMIVELRRGRKQLAVWYLLSNAPAAVDDATLALWYYWRWSIETYYKLMKTAGMHLETWQQTNASAILKRLLVASMACVTVWRLHRSEHPHAEKAREILVRLSGRQMKHRVKHTLPALLAGLWVLLAIHDAFETYTAEEIQDTIALTLHGALPQPP